MPNHPIKRPKDIFEISSEIGHTNCRLLKSSCKIGIQTNVALALQCARLG